jgi:hypothetical protein
MANVSEREVALMVWTELRFHFVDKNPSEWFPRGPITDEAFEALVQYYQASNLGVSSIERR